MDVVNTFRRFVAGRVTILSILGALHRPLSLTESRTLVSKMLLVPSHTVSSPSVHITYPPASLLHFPPAPYPSSVPPPAVDSTFARPFNISPELYNSLLDVTYPLTVAILYATTVAVLSRLNAKRGYKPWPISQTRVFYVFVVLHNVFLALYSAWTFVGMVNAFRHSWPGFNAEGGLTGIVDAMCKINGPRGLGNAVSYNPSSHEWSVTNQAIKLLGGNPDNSDVGRIWNEGLAYYGWLFYLSKFYEVLDTMIILAKGKKSSFLQTYHHAGAMICMWAGIRYMAPPIWMFVSANSLVHSLMVSPLQAQIWIKQVLIFGEVRLLRRHCPRNPGATKGQAEPHHASDCPVCCRRSLRSSPPFHCL